MSLWVIVRRRLAAGQSEAAFIDAWRRSTRAICSHAPGALEGELCRSLTDPTEYVSIMRWESREDWSAFWERGLPDPEGDPVRNELMVHVAALRAAEPSSNGRARDVAASG